MVESGPHSIPVSNLGDWYPHSVCHTFKKHTYIMKTISENQKQFSAKLLSISTESKANVNGKMFHHATIEFPNVHGELVTRQAIVYANNYKYGMVVGNEYLSVASKTADGVIINVSHLANADQASAEDFGF